MKQLYLLFKIQSKFIKNKFYFLLERKRKKEKKERERKKKTKPINFY